MREFRACDFSVFRVCTLILFLFFFFNCNFANPSLKITIPSCLDVVTGVSHPLTVSLSV